jgi:hypothetical protein
MSSSMKLMRAIGAPNFNPMPPDQHNYFLTEGTDVDQFVAWVWNGTLGLGHPTKGFDQRSPYCVDTNGRAQRVEDAAEYFGWDPAYARRIRRQAEAQGRVRTDKQRRIWICGKVSPVDLAEIPDHYPGEEEAQNTLKNWGETKANKKDCTRYVPAYILLEINKRPGTQKTLMLEVEKQEADFFDRAIADATAQLRAIRDQRQDNRFRAWQLPERRKIKPSDEPRPAPVVQLTLLLDEEKANETVSVQSSSKGRSKRTVQSPNRDTAQSSSPFLYRDKEERTTTTGESAPKTAEDFVVVVSKIQAYGGTISGPAAARFFENCRAAAPGCTLDEVLAAVDEIGGTLNKRSVRNPAGVFLAVVPPLLATKKQNVTRDPQETDAARLAWVNVDQRKMLERWIKDETVSDEDRRMAQESLDALNSPPLINGASR